jgi:hypothetical protein
MSFVQPTIEKSKDSPHKKKTKDDHHIKQRKTKTSNSITTVEPKEGTIPPASPAYIERNLKYERH